MLIQYSTLLFQLFWWMLVCVLFYIYFGYPLLLIVISIFRQEKKKVKDGYQPTVSLIITAYNEEKVIQQKIENTLNLSFPKDKLEIIIVSDGSTDKTDVIAKTFNSEGIRFIKIKGRKGKTYCQNQAVKLAKGEIIVFSDANSIYKLDAIEKLVQHFSDQRIACVSGELQYVDKSDRVEGENIYWRYEQFLKRLETKCSSIITTNGAIYAVRRNLYIPLPSDVVSDFVEALELIRRGYQVVYEPEAIAFESTTASSQEEYQRKVRIVSRAVYSLFKQRNLFMFHPLRYNLFAVQIWSHKILRWLTGLFLTLLFITNIPLAKCSPIYRLSLFGQLTFYVMALTGFITESILKKEVSKALHVPYYFCLSCLAMLVGFFKGMHGRIAITWTPQR